FWRRGVRCPEQDTANCSPAFQGQRRIGSQRELIHSPTRKEVVVEHVPLVVGVDHSDLCVKASEWQIESATDRCIQPVDGRKSPGEWPVQEQPRRPGSIPDVVQPQRIVEGLVESYWTGERKPGSPLPTRRQMQAASLQVGPCIDLMTAIVRGMVALDASAVPVVELGL